MRSTIMLVAVVSATMGVQQFAITRTADLSQSFLGRSSDLF